MSTLVVKFFVMSKGADERIVSEERSIELPREAAVAFTKFCFDGGTPEGVFAIHQSSLDALTPDEYAFVVADEVDDARHRVAHVVRLTELGRN